MAVPPDDVVRVAADLHEVQVALAVDAAHHVEELGGKDERGFLALDPELALEVPEEVPCVAGRGCSCGT